MAAPWVAAAWPHKNPEILSALNETAGVAHEAMTRNPVNSAVRATAHASGAAAYVQNAAAAAFAVAAAAGTASGFNETIWSAVSADATALESPQPMGLRPVDLAIQALWPIGIPELAHNNWSVLKKMLVDAGENWGVWTDWYEERLRGGPADETLELARVMIAEQIWAQGPRVANLHIRRLIEEHEVFQYAVSDEVISPIEPVPTQGPGPQFRANQDGLVDRAPPADVDADGNDIRTINQLRPLVLRCATELQARLSRNEFPELLDAAKNYQSALDPADGEIEWGEVWGLGVLLQNAATSAERQIETRMLPALEDPAKTALDSLLTLHGPLVLATHDGARLSESSAHFAMTRDQQQALRDAAQQIVERLNASPDVVTPRAAASLSAAAETIGQGLHPERGSVYGLATIKNISIALIGGAAVATPAVIGALLGTLFDAALIGTVIGAPFSLVAVEAVKKNPAFIALVTQLGAKLETMSDIELGKWLEGRARRLAPLRSFVSNNQVPLRQIAATTPELKWMLKYIDFIVAEAGPTGNVVKEANSSSPPDKKPGGGFGSGGFGEGPFGG